MASPVRPILILLAVLFIVGAGALAAGCTMPGGDGTQPTPTETVTTPTETQTPLDTGTPTETQTLIGTTTTAAGGQSGY